VIEPVKKTGGGYFRVLGNVNFSDMLEMIEYKNEGGETPVDEAVPDTTVANWIMERLGRLPRSGEKLTWRRLAITVTRVLRHRVMEINVSVDKKNPPASGGDL